MEFVDFRKHKRSGHLGLLFPGWEEGERVGFLSPHDDDALLGAGYLLQASIAAGGHPRILILCKGDAGYSEPKKKGTLVASRRKEALRAYGLLGVPPDHVRFFDVPDFSLMAYVNRDLGGRPGLFEDILRFQRENKISRMAFSSGYFEHWDHTAAYYIGRYSAPQAGDPILADLGAPFACRSFLSYSVWSEFAPLPEAAAGPRADLGVLAAPENEEAILRAIQEFSSQKSIIKEIVKHRRRRRSREGYLELYQQAEVREPVDYKPYFDLLKKCRAA